MGLPHMGVSTTSVGSSVVWQTTDLVRAYLSSGVVSTLLTIRRIKVMTTWRDAAKYLSSLWLLDREDDQPLDFHGAFIPAVAEGLILRHTQPGDGSGTRWLARALQVL